MHHLRTAEHAVKVGDLVKEIGMSDVGVIVECQDATPNAFGIYWRVLFGSELNYVREADLEVVSESR
tara:strand:- start:219 stop:419 length:201 start_codon:yes stop_codon:yes gene_type:complete